MNNNVVPPMPPQVPSGPVGNVAMQQPGLGAQQSMMGPMSGAPLPLMMGQVPAHAAPVNGFQQALGVPTEGQGVDARVRMFHALKSRRP